jgi:N-acetylglucosamine-6-phosphate deacetylase
MRTISAAHGRFGTTGFLPTLISGDFDRIRAAIAAVDDAIEAGVPGVVGIHVEGPFLSHERKGIHDASKFRTLDAEAFALLTSAKHGKTLVTLAPEETTPETIGALARAGVIVSAGHTDATYAQIRVARSIAASRASRISSTRCRSSRRASPGRSARRSRTRGASAASSPTDGMSTRRCRVALRCKRADRMMLVTDAMPSVGTADKTFTLEGRTIRVEGAACLAPDGTLAGTNLDMASAVRNAMELLGLDLIAAVGMASRNPANFLGLADQVGSIRAGQKANLVLVNDALNVLETWVDGRAQRTA